MTQFHRYNKETYRVGTPFKLSRTLYELPSNNAGWSKANWCGKGPNWSSQWSQHVLFSHRTNHWLSLNNRIQLFRKRNLTGEPSKKRDNHRNYPQGRNGQLFIRLYSSSSQTKLWSAYWNKTLMLKLASVICRVKRILSRTLTKQRKSSRILLATEKQQRHAENWKQIALQIRKKFNLDDLDGSQNYWHSLRTKPEMFSKRVQGGRSVIVWGATSNKEEVKLIKIDGRMDGLELLHQSASELFSSSRRSSFWRMMNIVAGLRINI